jgi:hypothetical protein
MEDSKNGLFYAMLKRNNKQIREDRAQSIGEEAEIVFKRRVEDVELEISRKRRELENMLDLSPDNSLSLIVADKFDATEFINRQEKILVEIRNLEIKQELLSNQYKKLFLGEGAAS